ncbi:MAG: hypothetical protein JKY93_08240 [Gammaproteobacteria bacterium]|nr:hypothetical protein [Gammaproteobacteria bacterium]
MNRVINPNLASQMINDMTVAKKKRVNVTSKLEKFPHVCKSITTMWGFHEIKELLEDLIVNEGRNNRHGFPPEVQEELMFLYQMLLAHPDLLLRKGEHITTKPKSTEYSFG